MPRIIPCVDVKEGFEKERVVRVAKEVEMLKKLSDEAANLAQLIEKQKSQRVTRISEVKEEIRDESKQQAGYAKHFEGEATDHFKKLRTHLEDEMASRFTHQDEVIDDLQKIIKSFQGTLKVFGKNI